MAHIPIEELARQVEDAAGQVEIGARYAHYKHPEAPYVVLGIGLLETNDEVAVIYKGDTPDGLTFVRPLTSFLEHVEHEGAQIPRFVKQ